MEASTNASESDVEKLQFISFMAGSCSVNVSRSDSDRSYRLIAIGEASMRGWERVDYGKISGNNDKFLI